MLSLLVRTTGDETVRNWIKSQYGGVPPRSDAAPWDLSEAVAALDELQRIAKTTPAGLSFWGDRGLGHLDAPGLGEVLAERLLDRSRTLAERELVLDVARAVRAGEAADAALQIAADGGEEVNLRRSAVSLANRVASNRQLLALGEQLVRLPPVTPPGSALMEDVITVLYERRLWDYDTVVSRLPPVESRSSLLRYRLEQDMTLVNARALLRRLDVNEFLSGIAPQHKLRRPRAGSLMLKAIELVVNQPVRTAEDYALLEPIALSEDRQEWHGLHRPMLTRAFSEDVDARRRLFSAGLHAAISGRAKTDGMWRWALRAEDLPWVLSVAEEWAERHPWLWHWVLHLSEDPSATAELRELARTRVAAVDPALVSEHDEGRRQYAEMMKQFEKEEREDDTETFMLDEVVRRTVANPEMGVKAQMHRIAWVGLCKPE